MATIMLKLALYFIEALVKDQAKKEQLKLEIIQETARYNAGVLDSASIRREYAELRGEWKKEKGS